MLDAIADTALDLFNSAAPLYWAGLAVSLIAWMAA